MSPRLILTLALASLIALLAAVPAGAASVAYIDGHNLWLSSPDGSQKFQMTQGGTEDASWNFPSQGPNGKTVVSHRDTFDGGSKRPVLYLYGADGKLITSQRDARLRRRHGARVPDHARHGLELQRRGVRLLLRGF